MMLMMAAALRDMKIVATLMPAMRDDAATPLSMPL